MRLLVHKDLPPDTGDFRLISRACLDAVRAMRETHRFLRGMIAWVGFRLTGYKITGGNSGELYGSFTEIVWQGVPATSGNQPPNLGARVITLVH